MVCARTWREIRRDIVPAVRPVVLWDMWWRKRRYDHAQQHAILDAYIDDYAARPDHYVKAGGGKGGTIAAPYEFHLVRILCSHYGLTEDQAWDFPYGRAHCYGDCYGEANGDESLVSRREELLGKIAAGGN